MITFDFETRGVIDLKKAGATKYAQDERTQVLCARWAFDNEEKVHLWHRDHPWAKRTERPDELLARIAMGEPFEAHNVGFEYRIWLWSWMREFPEIDVKLDIDQLHCSAAKASCMSLPRALGEACAVLGLEHQKDTDGTRLINKLSKPMKRRKKLVMVECEACGGVGQDGDETCDVCFGEGRVPLDEGGKVEWCEEEIEHRRNWAYCEQDVRAERGLSQFCPEMTPTEREYWLMDFRMNLRGIKLDRPAADAAIDLSSQEVKRLDQEIQQITGGKVPGGSKRKAFLGWVNDEFAKLNVAPMPNTQADTLSFMLYGVPSKAGEEARAERKPEMDAKWATLGERGEAIHRALEISMEVNRSSVAKFKRMIQAECQDGRLHDIMLYNGADRTGRWSGQGVQPHNFVRGYSKDMPEVWELLLEKNLDLITVVLGPALPALSKACRGALTASAGQELYAADFNAIEARKLAWLSGCETLLNLFRSADPERDVYTDMASAIYGRDITKKDKPERQLGKTAILGLGYEMGWEKFQQTVYMIEGKILDDEFCKKIVRIYRKEKVPEVPSFWRATERAAIGAVTEGGEHFAGGDELGMGQISYFVSGRFLHCRLPSGRLLAYLDPVVSLKRTYRYPAKNAKGTDCTVSFPAPLTAGMRAVHNHAVKLAGKQNKVLTGAPPDTFETPHLSFMGRDKARQWKRIGTYGGSLVENADQASSRDLLAEAMLRVDRLAPFALLLSIHDEVVSEAPIGTATVKEFENIMSEVPKWATGMPIAAEGWIGPRLRK